MNSSKNFDFSYFKYNFPLFQKCLFSFPILILSLMKLMMIYYVVSDKAENQNKSDIALLR